MQKSKEASAPVPALLILLSSMLLMGMLLFGEGSGSHFAKLIGAILLAVIAIMASLSIVRTFSSRI